MKKTHTRIPSLVHPCALMLVGVLFSGGCNGPANPEPVMINAGAIFVEDSVPGEVVVRGDPGAAENAEQMIVQNLDGLSWVVGQVTGQGAFDLQLLGLNVDRFRLIAFNHHGGFASLVVTTNGTDPEVIVVDEDAVGCLSIDPPYLDLGSGPAGQPLYGELTVHNDCPDPHQFMTQDTFSLNFTAVSRLTQEPLESGAQATVSVVFIAPAGTHEAMLVMEPDVIAIPDPEQVPLQVYLKAEALP